MRKDLGLRVLRGSTRARDRRERSRQRARAHRKHTGNAATHAENRKPRETMSYSDDEEDVYEYSEDDEDADDGAPF